MSENPQHHTHEWRLTDSRPLHGVEPPTTVKDWVCNCGATQQTAEDRTP